MRVFLISAFLFLHLFASDESFLLSKLKYEKIEKEYNLSIEKCEKIETENILYPQNFKKFSLSKEDWVSALFFLSFKAFDLCVQKEKDRYSTVSNNYISIGKYYKKDVSEAIGTQKIVFGYAWKDIQHELNYLNLPIGLRSILEKDSQLLKPFDAYKTLIMIEKHKLIKEPESK